MILNPSVKMNKINYVYEKLKKYAMKLESSFHDEKDDLNPAAEMFKMNDDDSMDKVKMIKRNILMFNSPEITMRISSLLYRIQPEAIVISDEQFSIHFCLMKGETIDALLKYSTSLIRDVAAGKIDPYFNMEDSEFNSIRNVCFVYSLYILHTFHFFLNTNP